MEESPEKSREKLAQLTQREEETLLLRAEGLRQRDIAEKMSVSTDTVKKHLSAVYEKLGLRALDSQILRFEAVQYYSALIGTEPEIAASGITTSESAMSADNPGDGVAGAANRAAEIASADASAHTAARGAGGAEPLTARVDRLSTDLVVLEDELEIVGGERFQLPRAGRAHAFPPDGPPIYTARATTRRRFWGIMAGVALFSMLFGMVGAFAVVYWWLPAESRGTVSPAPAAEQAARGDVEAGLAVQGQIEPAEPGDAHAESGGGGNNLGDNPAPVSHTGDHGTGEEEGSVVDLDDEDLGEKDAGDTYVAACGETEPLTQTADFNFVREWGVIQYTVESTGGALPSNRVRTLTIDERGLWLGFFAEEVQDDTQPDLQQAAAAEAGIVHFNREHWIRCPLTVDHPNVNSLTTDGDGRVWAALEHGGIAHFDGQRWAVDTAPSGPASNMTYHVLADDDGRLWAQTWEGVSLWEDGHWRTPYSRYNDTLFNNRVHALAFDAEDDIWVGHIDAGISHYDNVRGEWTHWRAEDSGLGGNQVRSLLARQVSAPADRTRLGTHEIWVATTDGGVSRFADGVWLAFDETAGLPSTQVNGLALDKYNRVWAATSGGVAYFDDAYTDSTGTTGAWRIYHRFPAYAVAFGPVCDACPMNDDQVWVATENHGITYSRIPLPEPALDVMAVRVPEVVRPGEEFRPEIVLAPRAPYQFREDRGDALYVMTDDADARFGAWIHIPVRGIVEPGEPFVFTDYDNLFVAPELDAGVESATYASPWRMWMHTRYAGPPIEIAFTVARDE